MTDLLLGRKNKKTGFVDYLHKTSSGTFYWQPAGDLCSDIMVFDNTLYAKDYFKAVEKTMKDDNEPYEFFIGLLEVKVLRNLSEIEKGIEKMNEENNTLFFKETPNSNVVGTFFQGYIDVSYQRLVEIFGEPQESDGYKVDAQWNLIFSDKTVATIYNYKDGKNYLGDDGDDVKDIRDWHVGGFNQHALACVRKALKL